MRKFVFRTFFFLMVFLLFAGVVSAAHPTIHQFSTTGYTTAYEYAFVPSGQAKFHLFSSGDPNDPVCAYLLGQPCGASGDLNGSFNFEEWGLADVLTGNGANHGDMTVSTAEGDARFHFGGVTADGVVTGGFKATGGTEAYKKLRDKGTYSGNAGFTFTVDWETCGGRDQPPCPVNRCAVFGKKVKINEEEVKWMVKNEGEQTLTLSSVLLNWPEANGSEVEKVKFAGRTVFSDIEGNAPVVPAYPDENGNLVFVTGWWYGGPAPAGIQIAPGQKRMLKVEFDEDDISRQVSDYTFELQFAEGCAAVLVDFP
ncbi:MAG: hypothetical protein GXP38_01445 [Chloroflexi bacterium]|nr:hypothetical protein [Chloroflexota bacterium]